MSEEDGSKLTGNDVQSESHTVPGYKGIGPAKRVQLVPRTQGR